jgi:hypothetical protein
MNAVRRLLARRTSCLALCAALLTLLSGHVQADEVAAQPLSMHSLSIDTGRAKNQKSAVSWSAPSLQTQTWMSSDLVPASWRRSEAVVLHRADDWFGEDQLFTGVSGFDASNLFRTRKEMKYRDTLRLLLTKRQLRVWLREDLHLQCEVKRYRAMDDGRELGLKFGLYYRFE